MITSVEDLVAFLRKRDEKKCFIFDMKISPAEANQIAALLYYDCRLQEFSLLQCDLDDASAELIANALQHHPRLMKLTLAHCISISSQGVLAFSSLVKTCKKLEELTFNNLGLVDQDAKSMVKLLIGNTSLKQLHLPNNTLNDLQPFCQLLKWNRSLITINVACNPLQDQQSKKIFMDLQNDNRMFRNKGHYNGEKISRELYAYFTHLNFSENALSVAKLKMVYQLYGLNRVHPDIEKKLIAKIYLIQAMKQMITHLNVRVDTLTIVTMLQSLGFNQYADPPASYTTALARLNQQRQTFLHDNDAAAVEDNRINRIRLSHLPLKADRCTPSRFWWVARKVEQFGEWMVEGADCESECIKP